MNLIVTLLAQSANAPAAAENDAALIWAVVLLAASIVLLALELFVPSGGLIGALATVAAVGSIVAFFRYDTTWGLVASGAYVVLGPIVVTYGLKWWINSPMGKRMILSNPGENDPLDPDSPVAATGERGRAERAAQLRQLIGARGVAVTILRPVGTVKIDGQRLDALSDSGVIEAGAVIVVTDILDNQVKVRQAE